MHTIRQNFSLFCHSWATIVETRVVATQTHTNQDVEEPSQHRQTSHNVKHLTQHSISTALR